MSSKRDDEGRPAARKTGRPWSLAAKLTAWYALSSFTIIVAASTLLYWTFRNNLLHEDDDFLIGKVRLIRTLLRDPADQRGALEWEVYSTQRAPHHESQVFLRLLDEAGNIVMETPGLSEGLAPDRFPPPAPLEREPARGVNVYSDLGDRYRVVAAMALASPDDSKRIIQAALVEVSEDALLADYRKRLWIMLGVALLVCALVGYGIARTGIKPLQTITATARRIRSTTLDERIEVRGLPAELAAFASTFNDMLDRLGRAFSRLSQFSADIAHELRTPLNNLQGEIEVALTHNRTPEEYREALGSCLEECGRLSRLIDELLFLARAENPQTESHREALDLHRELLTIRDFYGASAEEAGITVRVDAPSPCPASLDRALFQRAICNLLENALTHTPAGGTVALGAATAGDAVEVHVDDTGCGIPPEHLPQIFERFYRADTSRSKASGGAGLGLAIVKSIATLHGGTVRITSAVGQGTRVILRFPASMTET